MNGVYELGWSCPLKKPLPGKITPILSELTGLVFIAITYWLAIHLALGALPLILKLLQ